MQASNDPIEEGIRLLRFCNACRYCEALCPVWRAIEVRKFFGEGDIHYHANLCFDCRACYYACQYVPPHEYNLDPPKVFDDVRLKTYEKFSVSERIFKFMSKPFGTVLVTLLSILLTYLYTFILLGGKLFVRHEEFYSIIPKDVLVVGGLVLGAYIVLVAIYGGLSYWKNIHGKLSDLLSVEGHMSALAQVFTHISLTGGGIGCNYPNEEEPGNYLRLITHAMIFYGFIITFLATVLGFIYEDVLHIPSPFPLTNPVVILGLVGGLALTFGIISALILKAKARKMRSRDMDVSLEALLALVAITGLAVLLLRGTWALGLSFVFHMGSVLAFFVVAPFSKMVHLIYRYLSLVKYGIENIRYKLEIP